MKILLTVAVAFGFILFMTTNMMGASRDLGRPRDGETAEAVSRRVMLQTIGFGVAGLVVAVFFLYRIWR